MQYKKYTAPTRKETPLDENLRKAFGELIDPGMYVVEMTDRSMSPFIAKGSILVMPKSREITLELFEYRLIFFGLFRCEIFIEPQKGVLIFVYYRLLAVS